MKIQRGELAGLHHLRVHPLVGGSCLWPVVRRERIFVQTSRAWLLRVAEMHRFQRQIEHFSATGASLVLVGGGFGGPVKLRDKFLEFRIVAEGLQIVIRG